MFKTILVPTDGSALSDKAIHAAIEFAQLTGARLVGLSVAEPYPYSPLSEGAITIDSSDYQEKMLEIARNNVKRIADAASAANVICETQVRESFSPYEEIISIADLHGCDVVFMASHGRKGLNKLFIGSETQKVLAHSTLPVLVFR
ncbi:MAG: nucleotide-binding universal stress UspA family protein [Burkholderiaceae bacterium]|jgi:nucleotide-binding universal stress UspA family protein